MPRHVAATPSCIHCRLRAPLCVCEHAPHLAVETRVVLVMHRIEWIKPSNTGHLARLALQNVDIRIHGLRHQPVSASDIAPGSTLALFPGCGAETLTADLLAQMPRPLTLLVPDGNWNQTRHMMNRVPMMRESRAIRLDAAPPGDEPLDVRCLRQNFQAHRRSTFEALAQTLGVIEGGDVERRLLDFFRRVLASKNGGGNFACQSRSAHATDSFPDLCRSGGKGG